ncbi:MAG: hypothetical protein HC857_09940 [Synechococcales cyanobacterium RU_4_20]|nr:hypothetical protein [Synechococcales cyanobacterium RU_4_20]
MAAGPSSSISNAPPSGGFFCHGVQVIGFRLEPMVSDQATTSLAVAHANFSGNFSGNSPNTSIEAFEAC